mmetsp:Transcript_18738/g.37550  ORF Transcript_18738/g.37550 Transcript_18738/m.37550 type:complete len:245 (-) Transcript_18738:17-751(-)
MITGEHQMVETLLALAFSATFRNIECSLLGPFSSILTTAPPTIGLMLQLSTNFWRLLPKGLRRLLPCLLVPDVAPRAGLLVKLQEPSGGALLSPLPDDLKRDDGLVEALGVDVFDLALFDPLAVSLVAGMVIGPAASTVQHIVLGGFLDVLEGPVGVPGSVSAGLSCCICVVIGFTLDVLTTIGIWCRVVWSRKPLSGITGSCCHLVAVFYRHSGTVVASTLRIPLLAPGSSGAHNRGGSDQLI